MLSALGKMSIVGSWKWGMWDHLCVFLSTLLSLICFWISLPSWYLASLSSWLCFIFLYSIDAVSDRDFVMEFLSANSITAIHLSRLGEEWVLWASEEFGFLTPSDSVSTGSSIMPQKKNPDPMELVRGKSARVIGDLVTLLTLCKGLPLAYNRDLQVGSFIYLSGIGMIKVSGCLFIMSWDTRPSAVVERNLAFLLLKLRSSLPLELCTLIIVWFILVMQMHASILILLFILPFSSSDILPLFGFWIFFIFMRQEDKEPVFDSVKTVVGMLDVSAEFAQNITFNQERIQKSLPAGHLDATTLADYLVNKASYCYWLTSFCHLK